MCITLFYLITLALHNIYYAISIIYIQAKRIGVIDKLKKICSRTLWKFLIISNINLDYRPS